MHLVLNGFVTTRSSSCATEDSNLCADFISEFVSFWRLLNCKSQFEATRRNIDDRAVPDLTEKGQVLFTKLDDGANKRIIPKPPRGNLRVKTLTKDTDDAIKCTCQALISMSRDL